MNILVLLKQVPDTEAKITVSGGKINEAGIKWIISPYDEIGLEEAIQWKEKTGSTVTVLSVGTDAVITCLRTAYAMGADNAIHIKTDDYQMLDSFGIADAISKAIASEKYDVIFAGRQGSDSDNGQVPYIIGTKMGFGVVSYARKVDLQTEKAVIVCEAEGGEATYEAQYPVIITANAGLAEPRYPSLKGIMASKKKPIVTKTAADLKLSSEYKIEVVEFEPPPARPPGRIIEGEEPEQKAVALVKALHEEIKVI